MKHHTHLGDHQDTETTYHLCMSVVNVLKGLIGYHALEVLIRKFRQPTHPTAGATSRKGTTAGVLASLRALMFHVVVLAALVSLSAPVAAGGWLLAVACVFPCCATMRTIIEHRRADAPCGTDFSVETHGPVNRMFGTGPVSRYFGAAGFNRHLLHHWDPAISYTRFDDMERFFRTTPLAEELDLASTGYLRAAADLLAGGRRA